MKTRAEVIKTLIDEGRLDDLEKEFKAYGYEPARVKTQLVFNAGQDLPVGIRFVYIDQSTLLYKIETDEVFVGQDYAQPKQDSIYLPPAEA